MILKKIYVFLFISVMVFVISSNAYSDEGSIEKSQCIACHCNLKKLIRLCWEVEKIKPRPKASEETSGEG